ncbi:MAG TPA: gamma-glutamylcyclotransferase family protein [Candidatus Nanoarchaeia archaeon]|nr:gamma-glutamylcyclotransferase family protein [Candidatus Nanoarchaeia archaeon]
MKKLFVYGTLRDSDVQLSVIGRNPDAAEDSLDNYTLSEVKIDNEYYPAIRQGNGKIYGLVLKITEEELEKIDRYEELEKGFYERVEVKLNSGTKAYAYIKK